MAMRLRRGLGTRASARGGDSSIRPLTNQAELTEGLVATASAELGISRSLVYRIRQSNPPSGRGVFLMHCRHDGNRSD